MINKERLEKLLDFPATDVQVKEVSSEKYKVQVYGKTAKGETIGSAVAVGMHPLSDDLTIEWKVAAHFNFAFAAWTHKDFDSAKKYSDKELAVLAQENRKKLIIQL